MERKSAMERQMAVSLQTTMSVLPYSGSFVSLTTFQDFGSLCVRWLPRTQFMETGLNEHHAASVYVKFDNSFCDYLVGETQQTPKYLYDLATIRALEEMLKLL
jgi:hypothetical protein